MRIVIPKDSAVYEEQVTGRRSGQSFTFKRQRAWAMLKNGERRQVGLSVPRANPGGWAPGEYAIGEGSFIVGKFGGVELGDLELVLVQPTAAK